MKTKTVRVIKESRAKYDREPKMRMELKPKTEGQREYLPSKAGGSALASR